MNALRSQIPDLPYLRWARSWREPLPGELALIASGMAPPDPDFLAGIPPAAWLEAAAGDHPPLAAELADADGRPPSQCLVQPGSHWLMWILAAARLSEVPGVLIVESPTYDPLREMGSLLGAPVRHLRRRRDQSWKLDRERLEELGAEAPSLLLLSHLHNPSGVALDSQERQWLREWSSRTGCAILSDEVYLEFLPDEGEASLAHPDCPIILSVRSFTKVFGLGALRASYALGPAPWLARAARMSDMGPVRLPGPAQTAARAAWAIREELWKRARDRSAAGRPLVRAFLARHEGQLEAHLPEAGIICFPRPTAHLEAALLTRTERILGPGGNHGYGLDAHPAGAHRWIELLRREQRVSLTPGAFFGDASAFRLGYGIEPSELEEALDRLSEFFLEALEGQ